LRHPEHGPLGPEQRDLAPEQRAPDNEPQKLGIHLDVLALFGRLWARRHRQPGARTEDRMGVRMSLAEQVSRNNLAVEGAKAHLAQLPAETKQLGVDLAARNVKIQALNARQEQAKQALALLTIELNAEVKAAGQVRARIVKAAEFAFGARAVQLKAFRPVTEGRG